MGRSQVIESSPSPPSPAEEHIEHDHEQQATQQIFEVIAAIEQEVQAPAEVAAPRQPTPSPPRPRAAPGIKIASSPTKERGQPSQMGLSAKDKGKGIYVEPEKIKVGPKQVQKDEELARKLQEELEMEDLARIEAEQLSQDEELARKLVEDDEVRAHIAKEMEKEKQAEAEKQRKLKLKGEKQMYIYWLQKHGHPAKRLWPMKLVNIMDLYKKEKAKVAEQEKAKKERLIQPSLPDLPPQAKKPRLKMIPSRQRVQPKSPPAPAPSAQPSSTTPPAPSVQAAPSTQQDDQPSEKDVPAQGTYHTQTPPPSEPNYQALIVLDKVLYAEPLQVIAPRIIDWYLVPELKADQIEIIRGDDSKFRFRSWTTMVKELSRDDIDDLYHIGIRKFPNALEDLNLKYTFVGTCMDYLRMMFEPETCQQLKDSEWVPVRLWTLYESSGTHAVLTIRDKIEFFLVDKKYDLGVNKMESMLESKLRAGVSSSLALHLVESISLQLQALKEEIRAERERNEAKET